MIEKVDGSNKGGATSVMELWEKAINESKYKNEERQGIMDRGQRAAKSETENKIENHECKTCAARRYKDQSNDPSVSFQTPTHVPASQSTSAVAGHEMEHVRNEDAKARREDREVIHSSVSIQYAVCPECGARYAAGGETRTVTRSKEKEQDDGTSGNLVDSRA